MTAALLMLAGCQSGNGNVTDGGEADDGFESDTDAGFNGDSDTDNSVGDTDDMEEASVESVLETLGVETAETPRTDADGVPYPDDFNPLKRKTISLGLKTNEMLLLGLGESGAGDYGLFDNGKETSLDGAQKQPFGLLDTSDDDTFAKGGRKVSFSGDINGDGRDEALIIYHHAVGNRMKIVSKDGDEVVKTEVGLDMIDESENEGWNPADAAAGDLDNDGSDEIVIATDADTVLILDDQNHDFALLGSLSFPFTGTSHTLRVATGDIDGDGADEIGAAQSDITDLAAGKGTALGYVFDDAAQDFALLDSRHIVGEDPDGTGTPAVIADVAMGDLDNDQRAEVIFAGLTKGTPAGYDDDIVNIFTCVGDRQVTYTGMIMAYDGSNFSRIANIYETSTLDRWNWAGDRCGLVYFAGYEDLFVNTITLAGRPLIQMNNIILETTESSTTRSLFSIPEAEFNPARMYNVFASAYCGSKGGMNRSFDRRSASVAVGDVTGDLNEEIVFYTPNISEHTCSATDYVSVWGVDGKGSALIQQHTFPLTYGDKDYPVIQLVDLDNDTPTVTFRGEHKLVFTEPLVLAALAAPPCSNEGNQDTDACVTSFGIGRSHSETHSGTVEVTGKVIFGVSIADRIFTQSKLKESISVSASVSFAYAHEHEQRATVEWESGAMEDSVVFSTIPYDMYTYEVIGHPDPEKIGTIEYIMLPRKPITVMTELSFFNETTGSLIHIGPETLSHTVGDIGTYKNRDQALSLLKANGGMMSDEYTVGEGGGAVTLGLLDSRSDSFEWGVGLEAEYEVEITGGGVLSGFSVGVGTGYSFSIANSNELSCAGSVGHIESGDYADNYYGFGMFTYPLTQPGGQTFQVVDYWVSK